VTSDICEKTAETRLDVIARLIAILVSRDRSLQDGVDDGKVGFGPRRIAKIVGKPPGYQKVAAGRARERRDAAINVEREGWSYR
jgi:hypothetical protein